MSFKLLRLQVVSVNLTLSIVYIELMIILTLSPFIIVADKLEL